MTRCRPCKPLYSSSLSDNLRIIEKSLHVRRVPQKRSDSAQAGPGILLRESLISCAFWSRVLKFNEKWSGVSWKTSSSLALNFPFLTLLPDTVFVFVVGCCEYSAVLGSPQNGRETEGARVPAGRAFYEACSLQFFVLLKLEERVCGEK